MPLPSGCPGRRTGCSVQAPRSLGCWRAGLRHAYRGDAVTHDQVNVAEVSQCFTTHFPRFSIGEDMGISHVRTAGEIALACPCGATRARSPWPAPVHSWPSFLPKPVGKCGRLPLLSLAATSLGIPARPASPRCTECRRAFPIPEWRCSECGAALHQQCLASHDEMFVLARFCCNVLSRTSRRLAAKPSEKFSLRLASVVCLLRT